MKIKNVKLEWYVLNHDSNADKIKHYNIFHTNSTQEIADRIKKQKITTYEQFKESMKREFMYHYWSKTECEILVSGLFNQSKQEKIDIWYQIEPNLDRILEYIIKEMAIDFNVLKERVAKNE